MLWPEVAGTRHEIDFPLASPEPARTGDMQSVLKAQFAKVGDAPFRLESLEAPDFPSLLIPAATFKEIRTRLYGTLAELVSLNGFREDIAARPSGWPERSEEIPRRNLPNARRSGITGHHHGEPA